MSGSGFKVDLKNIHIGQLIKSRLEELGLSRERVCNFMQCEDDDIEEMLQHKSIGTDKLLRWSKLLEYDFFRVYSQHLILFSPKSSTGNILKNKSVSMPEGKYPMFKKAVYTKEVIDYLLELVYTKEKTPGEIIKEYKIPKTTLYKWIQKYPIEKK